jgi:hypothetical protein
VAQQKPGNNRNAVGCVLDELTGVVERHCGDATGGEHAAVACVGKAFFDRHGDLGVEHHTLLHGQLGELEIAGKSSLHPAPRRAVLAGHRASDAGPVVDLLFGRPALPGALGRRGIDQV